MKISTTISTIVALSLGLGASAVVAKVISTNSLPVAINSDNRLAQTNPLRIAFPTRAGKADLQKDANAVAAFISQEIGRPVEAIVSDETAAVEALRANKVDVAFLSSRPAIKAQQLANAGLYLAEVRSNYSGGHTYKSIFVVPSDSPLTSGTSKSTLEQLKGKRIAFTSPTSGSGFIFPVGTLVNNGLVPNRDRLTGFFGQVAYGGDYSKALQAVLRGQADVAAVSEYALAEPYITTAESKKLRILYSTPGVPAHGVAIDDSVAPADRVKLVNAMLLLNQPKNNKLLQNLYNSTKLVKVNGDSHLQPMRESMKKAGFDS
ncbi:MAG: phosphate/phosphite/phosphonate ABC transporter substrate-binding protein [Chamaesiphon sp.]|nr:phosphate/phosphite/phosphonate ABC transporter substrate-binding protein [Chamaesiphon sp.]